MSNNNEIEVVLIRHAESEWDRDQRFSGWADPDLTASGVEETRRAGQLLRQAGYLFDHAYSSRLQRADHTLTLLLEELGQQHLPREQEWRLNERHYGALQGQDKGELARRRGADEVMRLRRGYLDLPPPQAMTDPQHPFNDLRYADIPQALLPSMENLDQTRRRVTAFWNQAITPRIERGERLLISSHGNTLRALIMALDKMSVSEVARFEIPMATPIIYRFDREGRPLGRHYLEASTCIDCAA